MKKLLALLLTFSMGFFLISCNNDDDGGDEPAPSFDAPTVTAGSSSDVQVGQGGTVSFNVTVDENISATWAATASGVELDASSGDIDGSGSYELIFTAGDAPGAGSITLTVTDSVGQSANATAVFNVLAADDAPITFNTNGNIPATANLVIGETLAVEGVDVASEDGVSSVIVTVNGVANEALSQTYSGTNTSETYGFSVNTADLGVGSYAIVFTATDANGSTTTFSHALSVADLNFFTSFEEDGNGNKFLEISGSINTDYTLPTTNPDGEALSYYSLSGRVKVTNGATLTIGAGSVIKGRTGAGSNATALLVARTSKLMAMGTTTAPIIFTAFADGLTMEDVAAGDFVGTLGADVAGQWGGVIICGQAPISASADEVQIEGIPTSDTDGLYGGSIEDDNSGTIEYISIRHGGIALSEGNEINGLSLGGVGTGTTIKGVEVVANLDDGIEWYGGGVDIDNILVWNSGDDALDTDQDWQGNATDFLIVTPDGSAFELDGPEGDPARGDGNHQFTSGTVYAGGNISFLVDWDDDTNAGVEEVYFYGLAVDYIDGIASFGGDGKGSSTSWQTTLANRTRAEVFGAGGAAVTTEVAANANTVGVQNDDNFKWTWPGSDGTLDGLGL